MGLSTTEKKIAVTVAVDASRAKRGFAEYEAAARSAEKTTQKVGEGLEVLHAREANAREGAKKLKAEQERLAGVQAKLDGAFKESAMKVAAFAGKLGVAAAAVTGLAMALNAYAGESMRVEGMFSNLTISIEKARQSTQGLVDDMTLAKGAANAVALGVVKTNEDFATLARGAQLLGARVGTDAATALDDLTIALGRGSAKILDNLGIILKQSEAEQIYAKHLKVTTAQLTEEQKAESFRFAALKKIEEATQGVSIATDGLRAKIVRSRVEIENYKAAFLGAEQSAKQFEGSLLELVQRGIVDGNDNVQKYGDDLEKVKDQLIILGHNTEAVAKVTAGQLAEGITKARKQLAAMADEAERAKAELVRLQRVAEFEFVRDETARAAIHAIDMEIIALKGMKAEESLIEDAQRRRVEVLMEEAALRGDILKVTELIREEEKRMLTAGFAEGKRGGGRGDPFASDKARGQAELQRLRMAQAAEAMNREAFGNKQAFAAGLDQAQDAQALQAASQAMGNARRADIAQHLAQEQERNTLLFDERRRAREIAVAEGLDPLAAIAREEQERVAFHEREIELLRSHGAEKAAIAEQEQAIEEAHHRARLQRISAEAQARQKAAQQRQALAQLVMSLESGMADVATEAARAAGASAAEQERVNRIAGAGKAIVTGTLEAINAAAAFASLNPVQGAMHAAASAFAFAKGALMQAGPLSSGGGGGGVPSAGGSASTGFAGRETREARDPGSGAPVSREGLDGKHSPPKASSKSSGPITVHFNSYLPADKKQMGMIIRTAIKNSIEEDGQV